MAKTIPADEQVFMVSKSTNTTYSGSASLKAMSEWYTMDDVSNTVKPYKVFTALLTQSGGSDTYSLQAGPLVVGVTYMVFDSIAGDDFRNVGGPLIVNNNDFNNTYFIATGTTPTNWSGETGLEYNTGAPVATVLENTIGNVWFTYIGLGSYSCFSNSLFIDVKTFVNIPSVGSENSAAEDLPLTITSLISNNHFNFFTTLVGSGTVFDGALYNSPIEIRVYN
jgi:hypothetical protein